MGTYPVSATRPTDAAANDGAVDVEAVLLVEAAPPSDMFYAGLAEPGSRCCQD